MPITRPMPTLTATSRPYWEGCREGRLLLPVCDACGHTWFPPGSWCPNCLSPEISWRAASGRGVLWSWNVFHRGYFAGLRDAVPYLTALIGLEEGPFLTSTLVDADVGSLRCDLPVAVEFERVDDELTIPVFRIVDEPEASGVKEVHDRAV